MPRPKREPPDPCDKPMQRARRTKNSPTKVPTSLRELVKLLDKTLERWPGPRSIEYIKAAATGARDLLEQEYDR